MLDMLDASFKLFNLRFWCKFKKKKGLAQVIGLHLAAQIARQGRADGKQGRREGGWITISRDALSWGRAINLIHCKMISARIDRSACQAHTWWGLKNIFCPWNLKWRSWQWIEAAKLLISFWASPLFISFFGPANSSYLFLVQPTLDIFFGPAHSSSQWWSWGEWWCLAERLWSPIMDPLACWHSDVSYYHH